MMSNVNMKHLTWLQSWRYTEYTARLLCRRANKQLVKQFWRKVASQDVADFSRGTMARDTDQSAAAAALSCRYWVLNDSFCCVHRSRDSRCFSLERTTRGRFRPPSNTRFLGCTRVSLLNGISIGSAVFAGLAHVPNRQIHTHNHTDHATCDICYQ